jgi:pimeloyl-ACP methyl ester carboxylesterase
MLRISGRRTRTLAAAAASGAVIAVGAPTAMAGQTTKAPTAPSIPPPATTPYVLTLQRLHNFATSTRWVVLHRGARVLRTMLVVPRVSAGVEVPTMEFAHGWNSNPTVYASMLRAWASAGFLVIAPTSPGMARGRGLLSQAAASARQAADLPAVLTQVLSLELPVAVNRNRIALAGHSDGGSTVAMLAFNPGYRDRRIGAFLIFSGGRTSINAGRREWRRNTMPVFIADSYADQFGDFPSAGGFYAEARPPKVMVGIGRGETHLPPWSFATPFNQALWSATVDFASWSFTGSGASLRAMRSDLHLQGFGVRLDTSGGRGPGG